VEGAPSRWPVVAIVGGAEEQGPALDLARALGAAVMELGAALVCGGRGGVMAAACQGARQWRGAALGPPIVALLPGADRSQANPWADLVLPTGLGNARNAVVVGAADVVLAVGGGAGTLSEIALARKLGRPVILLLAGGGVAARATLALPDDPGLETAADLDESRTRLAAHLGAPA